LNASEFNACNAAIATLVDNTRLLIYELNLSILLAQADVKLISSATIAAFAGVLAGRKGIQKIMIGLIQKLVAIMLFVLGSLIAVGIV